VASGKESQHDRTESGGGNPTARRAVVVAAATGATALAVHRMRARHDGDESKADADNENKDGREDAGGIRARKDDLAETLSAKVTDAKKTMVKLKPQGKGTSGSGLADTVWEAASGHLMPVVHQAAAAAGRAVAEKAPDAVRTEVVPHFIEGFQKAS
jgi:hypothetical protein